ncbi:MAG TPA: hypothetical protein PLS32_08360, partial [Bacillota bacterium]|nr:hypothetical protein [Bacillota bacterium]
AGKLQNRRLRVQVLSPLPFFLINTGLCAHGKNSNGDLSPFFSILLSINLETLWRFYNSLSS